LKLCLLRLGPNLHLHNSKYSSPSKPSGMSGVKFSEGL